MMNEIKWDERPLALKTLNAMKEALSDLPEDSYDLSCELKQPEQLEPVRIRIRPTKASACPISIAVFEEDINDYFTLWGTLGRDTPLEIFPWEGSDPFEDLKGYTRAAISGKVRERVWVKDGVGFQSVAKVDYPGLAPTIKSVVMRILPDGASKEGATVERLDYEPYV
jgi:hypothetical protein